MNGAGETSSEKPQKRGKQHGFLRPAPDAWRKKILEKKGKPELRKGGPAWVMLQKKRERHILKGRQGESLKKNENIVARSKGKKKRKRSSTDQTAETRYSAKKKGRVRDRNLRRCKEVVEEKRKTVNDVE